MPEFITTKLIGATRVARCADAEPLFAKITSDLRAAGVRLAGVQQVNCRREDRHRCDMILRDLATGKDQHISEDRGAEARGCRLDYGALAEATQRVLDAIAIGADLVILNKFGKAESEGGGMREVIVEALSRDIPVLTCANPEHHAHLLTFAGDLAVPLAPSEHDITKWLNAIVRCRGAVAA